MILSSATKKAETEEKRRAGRRERGGGMREREGGRDSWGISSVNERERKTDRQTETERERDRDGETHRERQRQRNSISLFPSQRLSYTTTDCYTANCNIFMSMQICVYTYKQTKHKMQTMHK